MTRKDLGRAIPVLVPFVFSLTLSIFTMGSTVYWQDSGFFLTAVKERAALYPPGFVLYLLLAKLWTSLFFFVDFVVAVHLFSATCAAGAAAALSAAARDLLRSRGRLFRCLDEDPGDLAGWVGAAVGCLAASGFTFWTAAIYAKGYAFFYLVLALLLWRMIRADETAARRDFAAVAALIGLAWQAHPSATNVALAFAVFLLVHARTLGWKGLAGGAALAAACAAGPTLLLPIFSSGEALGAFGDPRGASDLLEYFTGRRFLTRPGAFGWEPARLESSARYFWEEFLGVGTALGAAGLFEWARRNRRLLGWFLAWTIPATEVTILFVVEGQHDHWLLGAWMPLYLAAAAGLFALARAARAEARWVVAGVAAAGVAWAVAANAGDVSQRGYRMAETFARVHLDRLEPSSLLLVDSDDAAATGLYLQVVRGERPDVLLVRMGHLEKGREGRPSWYDGRLLRRRPDLRAPDYEAMRRRVGPEVGKGASAMALVQANAAVRPVYLTFLLPVEAHLPGYVLVPAGALWKVVRAGEEKIDPRDWDFPVRISEVLSGARRERAQRDAEVDHQPRLLPEPYERRLASLLERAWTSLAGWHARKGTWKECEAACRVLLEDDPRGAGANAELLSLYAAARLGQGDLSQAEAYAADALVQDSGPRPRARAFLTLARVRRAQGRGDEARDYDRQAGGLLSGNAALKAELRALEDLK